MKKGRIAQDWDLRYPWAVETLKKIKAENVQSVFDVGSEHGLLKPDVVAMGLAYQAYDIVKREGVKEWNVEENFPYTERPDAVLFLEVVEHLNNPWLGLKNIAAILPAGGYLVLSTPNPAWSDSRISLIRKGVLTMFTKDDLDVNHHVFTPWRHVLLKLLEDNGFEIVACENVGKKTSLMASPFWSLRLPFRLFYRGLKRLLEAVDKEAIGSVYGVVARKKWPRRMHADGFAVFLLSGCLTFCEDLFLSLL